MAWRLDWKQHQFYTVLDYFQVILLVIKYLILRVFSVLSGGGCFILYLKARSEVARVLLLKDLGHGW